MRVLAVFVLLAGAVHAQPAPDLFPLHDGDTWTYRAWSYTATSASDLAITEHGHERWTASRVQTDGDTARAVLTVERWRADGTPAAGATCTVVRRPRPCRGCTPTVEVQLDAVRGRCTVPGTSGSPFQIHRGFFHEADVAIGGQTVPLGVAPGTPPFRRVQARARATGADAVTGGWRMGAGVGLLSSDSTEVRDGRTTSHQLWLVHARVDGREVGRPMDFRDAADGEVAILRVGPNPFATTTTLAFQTERPEAVTVEVFDARVSDRAPGGRHGGGVRCARAADPDPRPGDRGGRHP